jgi:hypothetical protein
VATGYSTAAASHLSQPQMFIDGEGCFLKDGFLSQDIHPSFLSYIYESADTSNEQGKILTKGTWGTTNPVKPERLFLNIYSKRLI